METIRSEMYFRGDRRTTSVLCLASKYLGLAVSAAGLDSLLLQAGESSVRLAMTRELHINNRVYIGGGGYKDSITFLQKGQYYNRADVECCDFLSDTEPAPASSRFEVTCVGDIIQVASNFVMKQDTSVGVAVIRLKGGNPIDDGKSVYYATDNGPIYVSGASGGLVEVNGDELIVKQPIMSASDGDDCAVALRFCATESMLFTSPPLAIYIEGRRTNKPIRAEFDKKRSIYCLNDEPTDGPLELYLENPYDTPICMPFMVTRKSDKPLGALLLNGQSGQNGIPVQACCERIHRGTEWVAYYDFTVAPIIPAHNRVAFTLEYLQDKSVCHLWTHKNEAQVSRTEVFNNGGGCVLDLTRSLRRDNVPDVTSFADNIRRSFDLLKIYKDQFRQDLCRMRTLESFCGPLETYVANQMYTPDRALRINVRTGIINNSDYTRINIRVEMDVLCDVSFDSIRLISFSGNGFYVGDGTSISYICPNEGEGLCYAMRLEQDEFVGFNTMGVTLRRAVGRAVDMRLFACEDGQSYARAELCLSNTNFYKDERLAFDLTVALLPDADNYRGFDKDLEKNLKLLTAGQIMRREAAANKVQTVAIIGQGDQSIQAQADVAEVMQSGGLNSVAMRFTDICDVTYKRVTLQDGMELPIQIELDKKGTYNVLTLVDKPEKQSERKYYLK